MTIAFSCPCGRSFKVPDENAGKKTKCPKCDRPLTVPAAEEEVVEDFEFVEDEPAKPVAPPPEPPKPPKVEKDAFDFEDKKKKKKKKRRIADQEEDEGTLAAMYMANARAQAEKDEKRVQGNDGGGWTLFGITVTAGIIGGIGSILLAVVGGVVWLFLPPDVRNVRIIIGSGVLFVLGGIAIINALFGGEED